MAAAKKPSLSSLIGDKSPESGEGSTGGLGAKIVEAIKAGDGAAVEAALSAFVDSHIADSEMSETEEV